MKNLIRVILILFLIFVALYTLRGLVVNLSHLGREAYLRSFLDNQFSKIKFEDLPIPHLPNSKEEILVSNGTYISSGQKSDEGIRNWRKMQCSIEDAKGFCHLDIDLVSFYASPQAWAFYRSQKDARMLALPHELFKQKEQDSFGYYISEVKLKDTEQKPPGFDFPIYASFLIIVKDSLFIGVDELTSLKKSDYKLDMLRRIATSR